MLILFITLFSISIVSCAIFLIYRLTQKKYDTFILKNSVCLQQLNEINCRYKFYPCKDIDQDYTYDNENFYDIISCEDYLIYQLQFIRKDVYEQISKINSNRQRYLKYLSEISALTDYGNFQASIGKLKLNKLVKKEKLLIEKQTYPTPITQFRLTVTLYCSKINGIKYNRKSESFSADDVLTLIKRLDRKNGTFYNDRGIWDAICRVERGKVSNKMRFSIYARDGYRCRICGVSERYARLEIDHIIPISKGGKSTYNNLQTLCHNCNAQKGDILY